MAEVENTQVVKEEKYSFPLKYPYEKQDDYKGIIKFTVLEEDPVNLASIFKSVGNLFGGRDTESEQTTEERQANEREVNGLRKEILSLQKNAPRLTDKSIELYLPVGLVYRDNVAYENVDLGVAGAAALGTAEATGNVSLGMKTALSSLSGAAGSREASLATVRILDAFTGSGTTTNAARAAAQVTVNPNTRTLFKSVAIREFAFTFKFMPTSQREAQEVERIIKEFRRELYPESIFTDTQENISIGYEFPNKFQIDILYDGKRIGSKILPAFLRDINVTYNPSNMGMHSDGRFNEIDMSLAFTESRTLDKKKIEEGF